MSLLISLRKKLSKNFFGVIYTYLKKFLFGEKFKILNSLYKNMEVVKRRRNNSDFRPPQSSHIWTLKLYVPIDTCQTISLM